MARLVLCFSWCSYCFAAQMIDCHRNNRRLLHRNIYYKTNTGLLYGWWHKTVVRTLVYDRWTFPWCAVDGWPPRGKPSAVCQPTWPTQPFILLGLISELNSGICYAYMRGGAAWEYLWVKADMALFAGDTVWSISEHVWGVCVDALYKSTYFTFLLSYHNYLTAGN